jgi:hypothetical protein
VTLPSGLEMLTFGRQFNQDLRPVTLPSNLQSLTFGYCFNQRLDKVTWPRSLQHLTFEGPINDSAELPFPTNLESIALNGISLSCV